jgi:hypothetical protein
MTKKKETSKMVIELTRSDRAKLKELQGKLEGLSIDRTLSELAAECLTAGIDVKSFAVNNTIS